MLLQHPLLQPCAICHIRYTDVGEVCVACAPNNDYFGTKGKSMEHVNLVELHITIEARVADTKVTNLATEIRETLKRYTNSPDDECTSMEVEYTVEHR
jgi:hypothetical protein